MSLSYPLCADENDGVLAGPDAEEDAGPVLHGIPHLTHVVLAMGVEGRDLT